MIDFRLRYGRSIEPDGEGDPIDIDPNELGRNRGFDIGIEGDTDRRCSSSRPSSAIAARARRVDRQAARRRDEGGRAAPEVAALRREPDPPAAAVQRDREVRR